MLVTDRTFSRTMDRLCQCSELVVDLETTGLKPWHGHRLIGVSVCIPGEPDGYYLPFRHKAGAEANLDPSALVALLDVLTRPGLTMGGHNLIRFDWPMMAAEGPVFRDRLLGGHVQGWDTIVDAILANENEPSFGLEALSVKYLGADAGRKKDEKARLLEMLKAANPDTRRQRDLMGRMDTLTPAEMHDYAVGDVLDCAALRVKYQANHRAWNVERLAREMYDYARLLACMEWRGILVDRALAEQRLEAIKAAEAEALAKIRAVAPSGFNPASPKQVAELLGTGDATATTLERYALDPLGSAAHLGLVPLLIEHRRLGKLRSTYYEGILAALDGSNVVHPQLNVTPDPRDFGGTKTGRLSCSNPNLQNVPKKPPSDLFAVRDLLVARPGMTFAVQDYERAEVWMAAHYSRDRALADAYYADRDLYRELAALTEEKDEADVTDAERRESKIEFLSIQYGVGARKMSQRRGWDFVTLEALAEAAGVPVEQWGDREWRRYFDTNKAARVKRHFFEMFPGIKAMMREASEKAARVGHLRLWSGRVRHFDGRRSLPFAAWNSMLQGGVGEMLRVAMQRLEGPLAELGAHQVMAIHDELVVETPTEALEEAHARMKTHMTDFDFWLRPRTEPSTGRRFGRLEAHTERRAA